MSKKRNLMRIDHGADNFEEILDVDRLVFVRASWRLNEDKEWRAKVKIVFDSGITEELYLTEIGWKELLTKWGYDEKYDLRK
ncbi:MAG: hypothetical protein WCD80_12770 [Desulfobaccales bacterium]